MTSVTLNALLTPGFPVAVLFGSDHLPFHATGRSNLYVVRWLIATRMVISAYRLCAPTSFIQYRIPFDTTGYRS